MSSWEQWQAAQGAPPAAFNQNNNNPPSNNNHTQGAPAPPMPATTMASVALPAGNRGAAAISSPPPPKPPPAPLATEGMRILSADEVKKELSAMDPDTRQKTIEMGNKLKDIVQAAIDIHTVTPNLSSSLLKEKILEKVGPMPAKEIDLPIHALKALYTKLYGKSVPLEHEAPLIALSKVFSPQHQQNVKKQEEKDGKLGGAGVPSTGAGVDSKEVSVNTAKAAAAAGGTAAAAIAGGGGAKKLGVSREQYEKLLSKMTPEERQKHPKYDQVMKQYEQ
jgi:hypothetical protein